MPTKHEKIGKYISGNVLLQIKHTVYDQNMNNLKLKFSLSTNNEGLVISCVLHRNLVMQL